MVKSKSINWKNQFFLKVNYERLILRKSCNFDFLIKRYYIRSDLGLLSAHFSNVHHFRGRALVGVVWWYFCDGWGSCGGVGPSFGTLLKSFFFHYMISKHIDMEDISFFSYYKCN